MKKIGASLFILITVIVIFLFSNGGKKQIIGTWYYEKNSNKSITIYENNEAMLGSEFYDYTYKDHILTLYAYGFKEHAYVVKVRGNKMYLTSGEDTDVYYKYYEEEEESEDTIPLDSTTSQQYDWEKDFDYMSYIYIAIDRIDVEKFLTENGYTDFSFKSREEYMYSKDFKSWMEYPTVIFTYYIYVDGYEHTADIEYYCIDGEWVVSDYGILFDAVPDEDLMYIN